MLWVSDFMIVFVRIKNRSRHKIGRRCKRSRSISSTEKDTCDLGFEPLRSSPPMRKDARSTRPLSKSFEIQSNFKILRTRQHNIYFKESNFKIENTSKFKVIHQKTFETSWLIQFTNNYIRWCWNSSMKSITSLWHWIRFEMPMKSHILAFTYQSSFWLCYVLQFTWRYEFSMDEFATLYRWQKFVSPIIFVRLLSYKTFYQATNLQISLIISRKFDWY